MKLPLSHSVLLALINFAGIVYSAPVPLDQPEIKSPSHPGQVFAEAQANRNDPSVYAAFGNEFFRNIPSDQSGETIDYNSAGNQADITARNSIDTDDDLAALYVSSVNNNAGNYILTEAGHNAKSSPSTDEDLAALYVHPEGNADDKSMLREIPLLESLPPPPRM